MELFQEQKEKIKELAKEFNLNLLLIFGSQAANQTLPESDVDFAFLAKKDLSFKDEILLNTKLSALFEDKKIIDLVNLRKANPLLKQEVTKNCLLLYGKEEDFFELKAAIFKDYVDHLSLLELEDFLIKKRQKLLANSIYGHGK